MRKIHNSLGFFATIILRKDYRENSQIAESETFYSFFSQNNKCEKIIGKIRKIDKCECFLGKVQKCEKMKLA